MEQVLSKWKDILLAIEKDKTKDMSTEQIEEYRKEKNVAKLN